MLLTLVPCGLRGEASTRAAIDLIWELDEFVGKFLAKADRRFCVVRILLAKILIELGCETGSKCVCEREIKCKLVS